MKTFKVNNAEIVIPKNHHEVRTGRIRETDLMFFERGLPVEFAIADECAWSGCLVSHANHDGERVFRLTAKHKKRKSPANCKSWPRCGCILRGNRGTDCK